MSAGVPPFVFCPHSLWTDVLNFRQRVSPTYLSWTPLAAFTRWSVGTTDPRPQP